MSNCTECNGVLLPYDGHNISIEENNRFKSHIYCVNCGALFSVTRKNIKTDLKGNVKEEND